MWPKNTTRLAGCGACTMFMHFCALFYLQLFLFLEIKLFAVVEDYDDQKTRVLMSISSFGFFVLVLPHIVMRAFLCWPALVAFFLLAQNRFQFVGKSFSSSV